MAQRSPHFGKTVLRLFAAGGFILVWFWIGSTLYLRALETPESVRLKDFSLALTKVTSHDLAILMDSQKFVVPKAIISTWIEPFDRAYTGSVSLRFNDNLELYVSDLSKKTGKDPVDARFSFENNQLTVLVPEQNGAKVDIAEASAQIRKALLTDKDSVSLNLRPVQPAITVEKASGLGITNRVAVGESNFSGSTAARIENIKIGMQRYNGLVLKPGQEFSFNDILGPVDATGGYVPEKVIKDHKIEYEYGGGLCQVSTTMFRAAIFAGFPILERKNHAFPVHYYSPQGFDSTIYPGVSDLKFTNDTGGYILVQGQISGNKLRFELYGSNPNRQVAVDGPHSYNVQPNGAMDAYFTRTITFGDGSSKSQTFYSVYQAPGAFPTEPNPYE